MPAPTGSSLERARDCPASHALPQIRESGKAAERGTEIHDYLRAVLMHPDARDELLAQVPAEYRAVCTQIDVDAILNGGLNPSWDSDAI